MSLLLVGSKGTFFEGRRYMDINVTLKVDNEAMMSKSKKSRTVATGWVEVMNCIKFPVFVRTYLDKETQEEKAFVSMPQRKVQKAIQILFLLKIKKSGKKWKKQY